MIHTHTYKTKIIRKVKIDKWNDVGFLIHKTAIYKEKQLINLLKKIFLF